MSAPTRFRPRLPPLLAAVIMTTTMPAGADDLAVYAGDGTGYRHVQVALETRPLCRPKLLGREFEVAMEAGLGWSLAPAGAGHGDAWHVGLTTLVRHWLWPDTALEYGLGLNLFSETHVGDKNISTNVQFGNSLGVVHRYAGTPWTTGLRYTHYSNAGIDTPNPGQDYLHLRIGYQFR